MPTRDGYVTTDDGVRLDYKIVGDGGETVVIPVGLYLEDLLASLAVLRGAGRSFGDYDWLDEIGALAVPRLVVHGREDGIPLDGARASSFRRWTAFSPVSGRRRLRGSSGDAKRGARPENDAATVAPS